MAKELALVGGSEGRHLVMGIKRLPTSEFPAVSLGNHQDGGMTQRPCTLAIDRASTVDRGGAGA